VVPVGATDPPTVTLPGVIIAPSGAVAKVSASENGIMTMTVSKESTAAKTLIEVVFRSILSSPYSYRPGLEILRTEVSSDTDYDWAMPVLSSENLLMLSK
jgi:hypothetical protein